jgi:hypothetical protein
MTRVRIRRSRGVVCRAALRLPISPQSVWGQLRDFSRYAQQGVFHADIRIAGDAPKAGAELTMSHHLAGIAVMRVGKILWWREGVGYSFSDLSRRGPRHGFPHVFSYRIKPHPRKPDACTLIILVRGKWTARWIPRPLAWLWLQWVFSRVVRNVDNSMLVYRLWRRNRDTT